MARTGRIKKDGDGNYHVMSRTNDRRFLFEEPRFKTMLEDALRRSAEFSGVRLLAGTVMDNHFHAVVRVTRPDEPVPEEELIRRIGVLKGERAAERLAGHWKDLHLEGATDRLEAEQAQLRRRMNDVSEFVKTFKETFDREYKRSREYCGSIWSGRFKSTLVEDGRYLATAVRYVLYNPIRAGLVTRAEDYPWSWRDLDAETDARLGSVPEEWLRRRIPQIGEGKLYGSEKFVRDAAFALGSRFPARGLSPHGLVGLAPEAGVSTHGWRIAAMAA